MSIDGFHRIWFFSHETCFHEGEAASLTTTVYAIPIMNPYLADGLFVGYLVRGRYRLVPEHPEILTAQQLGALTTTSLPAENPDSAGKQAASAAANDVRQSPVGVPVTPGLKEMVATHEPD